MLKIEIFSKSHNIVLVNADSEATTEEEEELRATAVDSEATTEEEEEELRATAVDLEETTEEEELRATAVDSEATTEEEELRATAVDSEATTEEEEKEARPLYHADWLVYIILAKYYCVGTYVACTVI